MEAAKVNACYLFYFYIASFKVTKKSHRNRDYKGKRDKKTNKKKRQTNANMVVTRIWLKSLLE